MFICFIPKKYQKMVYVTLMSVSWLIHSHMRIRPSLQWCDSLVAWLVTFGGRWIPLEDGHTGRESWHFDGNCINQWKNDFGIPLGKSRQWERERDWIGLDWIGNVSWRKNQKITNTAGLRIEFASGDGDEPK